MTDHGARGPTATSDPLAGTQWEILSIDAVPIEGGDPVIITFDHDGRISGSTGLNQLSASYSLTAEYLTVGALATTRRAGPPQLMEQEHRVVASLAGMCPYRREGRRLSIDGPLGHVRLSSTGPAPEVPASAAGATRL